jgi:DNA-directed RNA polymerase specialized sigma24 family protein
MSSQSGQFVEGEPSPASPPIDAASDYRRLLSTLASRARRLGSRDPESAAQEALKRSLENASSQPAIAYYFSQDLPAGAKPPDWPLDQLFAWLHGVLHYVVREEHHRASNRREVPAGRTWPETSGKADHLDPADPAPGHIHVLIQKEMDGIVADCLPMLDSKYQAVLKMRADGLKYAEIARRLGTNENTVATWVSRAIGELAERVRMRTNRARNNP